MTSVHRIAIAVVAIGIAASGCGSGAAAGDSSAHLSVQVEVRRGACVPVHPGLSPYGGWLVFVRSDGRRVRMETGSRGHGRMSLAPGGYRLAPPLPGSAVHLDLNGRAVIVIGRPYPLRIVAGETARLAVVILPRRGECTSSGAGA
jgi:hypothetical protein